MTTERQAAKADAKDVDLAQAERVADLWLALALRKLSRDPQVIEAAADAVNLADQTALLSLRSVITTALQGVADHLERA